MSASLPIRAAASRKGWASRRAGKAARENVLAAALAGGPPLPAPERGSALLDPDDCHPGKLMRRALDRLRAAEAERGRR